jgi:hypothetical protein
MRKSLWSAQHPRRTKSLIAFDRRTSRDMKCPDATDFTFAKNVVRKRWMAEDYEGLEALYARWCTGKDRFLDGRWKLAMFGEASVRKLRPMGWLGTRLKKDSRVEGEVEESARCQHG